MHVVLMRSTDESDSYVEALKRLGKVHCVPVLSFQFINLETLKAQIRTPQAYSGIIFTSKRAVEAVSHCMSNEVVSLWKEKLCYVVGEATCNVASSLGFNCVGKESGNAEKLAKVIIATKEKPETLPLLFVCGQLKKDTLPLQLHKHNVAFETVIVYHTVCNPSLLDKIQAHVNDFGIPSHIVFFSPSGYKFSCEFWKEILGNSFENIHLVAIGPSTASDMQSTKHEIIVSEKPNSVALFEAISHCHSKEESKS